MKADTAYRKRDEFLRRVMDLHSKCKIYKMSSSQTHEDYHRIESDYRKTPRYVRAYVEGYHKAFIDRLHHYHLEFCYLFGGELHSTRKDSPRYYGKKFKPSELCDRPAGFFWRDTDRQWTSPSVSGIWSN
jgi:hypothetical protein